MDEKDDQPVVFTLQMIEGNLACVVGSTHKVPTEPEKQSGKLSLGTYDFCLLCTMPRFSEKTVLLRQLITLKESPFYDELSSSEQDCIDCLIALLAKTRYLRPTYRYVSPEPPTRFQWIGAMMSYRQFRFNFHTVFIVQ